QLKSVLEDATKVLKRNSADLGADVDQLRADIRTANGLVTAVNNSINDLKTALDKYKKDNDQRMDSLETRVGQIERGKPSADSSLADDGLYFAALAAQELKNCTEARTYLGLIKSKYPKSNVAKQAADLDAAIKKELKNKAKCTS